MSNTSAAAIRRRFLEFFEHNGHAIVKSSPLVPANDPTLMFVNAGMVQFKDVFVGADQRPYNRATTSQKCMRVSGKHNDLEEVGRTARHHTFFEMLGNFSFGDYFKAEAIALAWKFSVSEMGLDPARIYITVFGGADGVPADDEARSIWKRVTGFGDERILDMGMKDNFWAMGDVGPCGPCTEIHYDLGGEGPPTREDFESGRVVEFWNNVFMQFDRQPDGSLQPLPAPSVDTGMGLERLAALVQGQTSNYHTDLFAPILDAIGHAAGKPYERSDSDDDVSIRVVADHARAATFLVADGIQPSNEGRGYVLRRIMRRAIRHGKRLGFKEVFFHRICDVVVETMGEAFGELRESRALIEKVAQVEEEGFRRTLDRGLTILSGELERAKRAGAAELPGEAVFKLYDTYGFPKDLTCVIAAENGLGIDDPGFVSAMAAQRALSGGSELGGTAVGTVYKALAAQMPSPSFVGYEHEDVPPAERESNWRLRETDDGTVTLETQCTVRALIRDGERIQSAHPAADSAVVEIVLDPTPFYGESGGQVGDRGVVVGHGDCDAKAEVTDSQKPVEGFTVSRLRVLAGTLAQGDTVWAGYVPAVRRATRAHHSATHILHASLRTVLGDHVKQAGSWVDPDRLRFDYSHFEALTDAQRTAVEDDANDEVATDALVKTEVLPYDEAKQRGAIALFGEKYGDEVRVVSMGTSVELCGGTHAKRTSDIGMILLTREEAVASGVRRLEAEVGGAARRTTRQRAERIAQAAAIISGRSAAPDDHPILLAIAKTARTYAESCARLRAAGTEVEADAVDTAIECPVLAADFGLNTARAVRDTWAALTQLCNARGEQGERIVAEAGALETAQLGSRVIATLGALSAAVRAGERRLTDAKRSSLTTRAADLMAQTREVGGVRLLATRVEDIDSQELRGLADDLRSRLDSGVLCLGAPQGKQKVALLVAVTKDLTHRFGAGDLIKELAPIVGGRGGGKPQMAQAGGNAPEELAKAFARFEELIRGS